MATEQVPAIAQPAPSGSPATPVAVLSFRDELDAGTAFKLPPGVRRIVGGYCGLIFQHFGSDKNGFPVWQLIEEEKPEKLPELRVGLFIGARDTHQSRWYPAGVLEMTRSVDNLTTIKLHFAGWDPVAYDEDILESDFASRLIPLGSQSVWSSWPAGTAVAHTYFDAPSFTRLESKRDAAAHHRDEKIFFETVKLTGVLEGKVSIELRITRYVEVLCVVVDGSPELNRILAIRFGQPMNPARGVERDTSSIKELSEGVVAVSNTIEGTSLVISAFG